MENYSYIIIVILLGVLIKKSKLLAQNFHMSLNRLLIYVFIPILTLLHVPEININSQHLWLIATPWIIYFGAMLFFYVAHKITPIDHKTRGALIMTAGIGSISFVGFPIFELFYGAKGLSYGIILSLGGTFIVCNSIGIITGIYFKNEGFRLKKIIRNLLIFPPFIALLIAILLNVSRYEHPVFVKEILTQLSKPFSMLALFSVGYQIVFRNLHNERKHLYLGLFYKLILAPALLFFIFYFLNDLNNDIVKICILGAGIGSMNTIAIIAAEFDLRPKLALLMPGFGIPISMITILIIQYLLNL
ncbi:hypothetical protein C8N46_103357 [Kordia periserrulae]|uniref:Transporter n=1 Tax=Kordia periserrulae TaxID=701523 RepID=A0A2T6C1Y9_9FLAO|nr:AEC family transporter [Kordia periserrulae]PTX62257.1 hypothetical protein C8N46_103357 [Kordia periserrulae]